MCCWTFGFYYQRVGNVVGVNRTFHNNLRRMSSLPMLVALTSTILNLTYRMWAWSIMYIQTGFQFFHFNACSETYEYFVVWQGKKSPDSSVGIALGYGLDDRGSRARFLVGAGNFLFTTASRTALGPAQPPIQWVIGNLSLGVKRLGREADHSPPSSVEVKECMELYLHSPIRLHGVVLS
jgi:hypothetical protein